jgi:hypothetical protein
LIDIQSLRTLSLLWSGKRCADMSMGIFMKRVMSNTSSLLLLAVALGGAVVSAQPADLPATPRAASPII